MKILKENVFSLVSNLVNLKYDKLKAQYFELFGELPGQYENRNSIIPKIAYRIQEIAYGGLSDDTKFKLVNALKPNSEKEDPAIPKWIPGTIITKIYKGETHQVIVCEDHYVYQNLQYKSLSAIAKKITGTNWNGKVFFNVK